MGVDSIVALSVALWGGIWDIPQMLFCYDVSLTVAPCLFRAWRICWRTFTMHVDDVLLAIE